MYNLALELSQICLNIFMPRTSTSEVFLYVRRISARTISASASAFTGASLEH